MLINWFKTQLLRNFLCFSLIIFSTFLPALLYNSCSSNILAEKERLKSLSIFIHFRSPPPFLIYYCHMLSFVTRCLLCSYNSYLLYSFFLSKMFKLHNRHKEIYKLCFLNKLKNHFLQISFVCVVNQKFIQFQCINWHI